MVYRVTQGEVDKLQKHVKNVIPNKMCYIYIVEFVSLCSATINMYKYIMFETRSCIKEHAMNTTLFVICNFICSI